VSETGSRIATWTYDAANRLITERRSGSPAYANTFAYDSTGNRTLEQKDGTRTTFAYDLADQLTTSVVNTSTTTYTFDGAGNLTLQVAPTNNPTTYTWNDDNRQTRVQTPGGVDLTAEYRYDGLRYEKENGGTTTRFVFDGQNYLLETNAAGVIQAAYTVEPRTYGNVVSQRASGATRYFHLDALGSTRVLTNSSQTLTDLYLYDAWGVPLVTIGATTNPFRWVGGVGYYHDTDTGLYYVRARIYASGLTRWMSKDPRRRLALRRPYCYVLNSPTVFIDATGSERMRPNNPIDPATGIPWDVSWPGGTASPALEPANELPGLGKYGTCECVPLKTLRLCIHVFAGSWAGATRRNHEISATNNILAQCCIRIEIASVHRYSNTIVNAERALGENYELDTSENNIGGEANHLPSAKAGCINVFFIRGKNYLDDTGRTQHSLGTSFWAARWHRRLPYSTLD
jgi:RHS repeat-associated protein